MAELIFAKEFYVINGILMDVHRHLGPGFLEIVYKDAIEYEFQKQNIKYEREKQYVVPYKDVILKHMYYADFVVMDSIILEVKAQNGLPQVFKSQIINYLKVSGNKLGILANFASNSLEYKRYVV